MRINVQEANRGVVRGLQGRFTTRLNEAIKASYKVDLTDAARFPFDTKSIESGKMSSFSWKKFREAAYEVAKKRSMEANSETVFGQLLRAGVQNIANSWYELVETDHEKIGETTTSNKLIELYAPLHRGAVPRRVPRGEKFPETKVQGLDIQIENEKFGALATFERELFDDDQTGQIAQRAQDIGENMRILEDAWFFQRFLGSAGSFAGDSIPASQTYATVWSTSLTGGGSNKLAAYSAFSSANVQALDILLMNQLDLNGNKMLVNPDTLLVGTKLKFAAAALLNSEWYPSTSAMKAGGTGSDTGIGQINAKNVLKGLYALVVSRFYTSGTGYALGEAGKGIIMQRREALEVVQENPASGMAFEQDEFRMKSRARWEPDWIDPRFWAQGSDGTV